MEDEERRLLIEYAMTHLYDCIPHDVEDYDEQLRLFAEGYANDILNRDSDINRTLMSEDNVLLELPFEENDESLPF